MNKLLGIFLFVILFAACDKLAEKNYLSKEIDANAVKRLTEAISDEEEIVHHKKQEILLEYTIPVHLKQNVSLTLNDKLSLKSVLCETARKLNIDFQIDPIVNAKIIFSAHNRPFIEILDAICDIADLRYSINNGLVSVVNDSVYTVNYNVQFLNLSRDSENKISIATEVSSGASQDVGTNKAKEFVNSGASDSNVVVKTKNDFWAELENGIRVILNQSDKANTSYSINKHSGIVTVRTNSKLHKHIRDYINIIKISTESQVLIEAKIIEVVLKNEYRRGIDWNILSKKVDIQSENYIKNSGLDSQTTPFSGKYKSKGMNVFLNAIEEFGATRTISNPRVTAMNNQPAILKVAENHVYFKLNYDKTYSLGDNGRDSTSVSSDIRTVPIGFVMFVQPSIDLSNGTITLFLRPTISKLAGSKRDPAVDIAIRSMDSATKANYEPSYIPVTEVREVSSVLKLNDGEIAILGGFMEVRSNKTKAGLPIVKDIPVIGETVSSYGTGDDVVELVILIKVKISGNTNPHQKAADIRLQRFVPDPRPF
jgi:general secretion pathway protein D